MYSVITLDFLPFYATCITLKYYTRAYANGSIVRLRKIAPEELETATKDMIKVVFFKRAMTTKQHKGRDIQQRM